MFKFKLEFPTIEQVGTIYVSEPFGFDSSTHSVNQDEKRFGRDVILGNEDIELEFTREEFERLDAEQTLINGKKTNYATHGFDYLIDLKNTYGWEAKAKFIIEKDNVDFLTGYIDFYTAIVSYDSIKFKIIQRNLFEKIKRNEKVVVDAFSDKALDDTEITPCQTIDILLKAKPIIQNSSLNAPDNKVVFSSGNLIAPGFFNGIKNITNSQIQDTFTWLFDSSTALFPTTDYDNPPQNFRILRAKNTLSFLKVKLKLNIKTEWFDGGLPNNFQIFGYFAKGSSINETFEEFKDSINDNGIVFYDTGALGPTTGVYEYTRNDEVEIDLPYTINQGEVLYFVFLHGGGNSTQISKTTFIDCSIDIIATSTSIDSVIKGVRLIDLLKHNIQSVGNVDLISPMYDVGGTHYNNFVFNGYMLGRVDDKPFNNTFESLMNIPSELCSDYQINPNNVEILPYDDFYKNVEIGSFKQNPDIETTTEYNKRYFVKTVDYSYKTSSKGRETNTQNTIDDVHGQTQWLYPSERAENNLKIELDHIRSAFIIEEQRRQAVDVNQTNSLQNDTNLFIIKCVQIPPATTKTINAVLIQQWNEPYLSILSTNFNWTTLGMTVGQIITVTNAGVDYSYSVIELTPNTIKLQGGGAGNQISGEFSMSITYILTGVQYMNHTNEGFQTIEGIEGSDNYSNLLYSIGRNLKTWYKYLATCGIYLKGKLITNTQFDNNGNLFTKLFSETVGTQDNAPIVIDDISESKILTPIIHNLTVLCDFNEATQLFEDIQSLKGFIRCETLDNKVIKGYPKKAEYLWKDGELDLVLEEKFEMNGITIVRDGNSIFVNETGYSEKIGLFWFRINGIYVSLYDEKNILLANTERWDNVSINGVKYTDVVEFSDALTIAIN